MGDAIKGGILGLLIGATVGATFGLSIIDDGTRLPVMFTCGILGAIVGAIWGEEFLDTIKDYWWWR